MDYIGIANELKQAFERLHTEQSPEPSRLQDCATGSASFVEELIARAKHFQAEPAHGSTALSPGEIAFYDALTPMRHGCERWGIRR